jgi:CHAD domain-containing protein
MARAWEVPGLGPGENPSFRRAAGLAVQVRLAEAWSHRDAVVADEDIEAVHAMRVSLRRLRSTLDAFAPAFPARRLRRELRLVRRLADALGAARDLDVLAADLHRRADAAGPAGQPGLDALARRTAAQRRAIQPPVVAALDAAADLGFPRRLEALTEAATGVPPHRPGARP